LKIYDKPKKQTEESNTTDLEGMTDSERNKQKRKANKLARQKVELAKTNEKERKSAGEEKSKVFENPSSLELDKDGTILANRENLLDEASKFLRKLTKFAPTRMSTHILAAKLYLRKKKNIC